MVRFTPRRLLFAAFVIASLATFFFTLSFGKRGYSVLTDQSDHGVAMGETCSPFSGGGMDNTTIVIKFGAPEVTSKLVPYIKTLTPCQPNLVLFSDRGDSINGIEIVDALANLRPEHRHNNPDFEIYYEIQRSNKTLERTTQGWKLDKYKFLPMMELTANLRPDSNWFVFIELDTYVNWDNLFRFLGRFDPKQAHYFGSPVWPKRKPVFAHGGSGFVLSQGALSKLVARGKLFAADPISPGTHMFGQDMQKECCGDEVLARVLNEVGVKMRGYWPMFNGEKPSSLPFGREHWCELIVTLHHLGENDFDMMRRFESKRHRPQTPLTFEELFSYIEPSLVEQVDDWSNMSEDITLPGQSFAACFNTCLKDSKCFQCEHFGDTCRLSHSIRLGHKALPDGDKRWTSGWVRERIEAFKAAHSCQDGAHIVHPNP